MTPQLPQLIVECLHNQTIHIPNESSISAGNSGCYFAPDHCQITAGSESFVQCRNSCDVTVGSNSSVDAGNFCTVRCGIDCNVNVGPGSVVNAGDGTEIRFNWWLGDVAEMTLVKIGTGEYQPNTPYQLRNGQVIALN